MGLPIAGIVVASIFGGYFATSMLLLRFPTLIHKKKKLKFRCRHISHRGGAGENLENTLTAFGHAIECGTEMLELDVQLTADKQVVVSHDNNLFRVCGEDIVISQLDYEKLPLLKHSLDVTFTEGHRATVQNNDRRIPLLREVLEKFPDVAINLDIKEDNSELIDKTHELICEYKRKDTVAWGNFRQTINDKLYNKDPEIPLFFSLRKVVIVVVSFYFGLLPFIPIREGLLDVIFARVLIRKLQLSRGLKVMLGFIDWLAMSPVLFRHLERRGIQTYLWVLNEDEEFDIAFNKLKVAGVMTDYPSKLQSYLKRMEVPSARLLTD